MASAPMSASIIVQNGPVITRARSTTRTPASGNRALASVSMQLGVLMGGAAFTDAAFGAVADTESLLAMATG
jgi:hypothetical protein